MCNSELNAKKYELAEVSENRLLVKIEEANRSLSAKKKLLMELDDNANGHDRNRKGDTVDGHVQGYNYDPSYDLLEEHAKALKSGGFHVGGLQSEGEW